MTVTGRAPGVTASIIIPAHNERVLIERCLRSILKSARPGEFEVIVVCNGCSDDTAAVARAFGSAVAVLETAVADKSVALDLGDRSASAFPRVYLDADVLVDTEALRSVAQVLAEEAVLAAAPEIRVDTTHSSWAVRAYYSVWARMAWATTSMVGSGLYALSERGRDRFGSFPTVRAEDYWVSAQYAPEERRTIHGSTFTITAAPDLPTLVRRKARILAYNRVADRDLTDAPGCGRSRGGGLMALVRSEPRLLPAAVLYVAVAICTNGLARWKIRRDELDWVSDR